MTSICLLDGPLGTELLARGVATPLPGWSAHALESAPEVVAAIHADYAAAGARVHTTNTFRTRPDCFPRSWRSLARRAVELARAAVPAGQRVAGCIAPLADCYRPELSPADDDPEATRRAHGELARLLADGGCDLLLCETFPHPREALLAADAALATGRETWISLTPGYTGDLLTPTEVAAIGREAVQRGVAAVLVNCVPVVRALEFTRALAGADLGVPFGCYANAGAPDERMGWSSEPGAPERYAERAAAWVDAGATLVGGCCGTGPAHTRALALQLLG